MEFYIGQIFEGIYPPEAAIWCNNNNAQIDKIENNNYQIVEIPEPPIPTHEEQSEMRAQAYRYEVDPITSHIQRLRDAEQTEEILAEIETLIAERDAKVAEIKERYPYYDNGVDNVEEEN